MANRKSCACVHDEKEWARHCGAVLLGKKPAALFTMKVQWQQTRRVKEQLEENGVVLQTLCKKRGRVLVLVYEPQLLQNALGHPVAKRSLAAVGYPRGASLEAMLVHLKKRVCLEEDFPHEIGFFLGYPPADVVGFMHFGGRSYKHCCMWKVYGDVNKAEALCAEYETCRRLCCAHIEKGGSLRSIRAGVCFGPGHSRETGGLCAPNQQNQAG